MKLRHLISITLFMIFATACEQEYLSSVPNVPVKCYLYLDQDEYSSLDYGTSIAVDGYGYAGLIIYCVGDGLYYAYDRCCPLHTDDKEELELDGALAMCPTDSIYFNLTNKESPSAMSKTSEPAFLKSYYTSFDYPLLYVYNQ